MTYTFNTRRHQINKHKEVFMSISHLVLADKKRYIRYMEANTYGDLFQLHEKCGGLILSKRNFLLYTPIFQRNNIFLY